MTAQEQALEILKKHGKQMAIELLTLAAWPAIEKSVKDSATPIDDVVLAALEAPVKKAIEDAINKW